MRLSTFCSLHRDTEEGGTLKCKMIETKFTPKVLFKNNEKVSSELLKCFIQIKVLLSG
jgi:hypothetical protein